MFVRWFVAFTPIVGSILFPLLVSLTIAKLGISQGVLVALILTTFWFVAMLRTSEMPH